MKNKQTILIIDDNSANLVFLGEYMKLWGFDFMVADNGESGLRKAGKGGDPDLILLDVFMPVMDGFEVCRLLKNNPSTADIPVIFLTANNDESDKVRGFETGAVDYITKPFHPKEVLARINRHLELRALQKQLEIQNAKMAMQNAQLENEIIERKKLEIKNLQLQKADSLGQMAGGIAHLFNNYLYTVSGNLELALEELPDDSLIRDNLTEAMKAARRCSDVSGAMLTYLGQSFIKTESLDIADFCRKHLPDFQSSVHKNIAIETDLSDTELIVSANANQMQQVLNHLITNASESIGENKGKISLSLTTRTIPASDISKLHIFPAGSNPSSNNYACLQINDTGCGISSEEIHKLFDPFFTTKFTGRGLGLAIVSGIVKSWGGCIGVRSKVGHGSTFMVFIPLSEDNSIRQSQKVGQVLEQLKSCSTVLLVDDNAAVLKMTTIMLKKMGFEVISAVNGVEAVELFRQHKESVSCLITDLSMPELDGWGTLAEIRKMKPDIPVILASGYDEAFAMSRIDSEKPQAFLHKPYTMNDLKNVLSQLVSLK
ncbi:MAG: response regulator [Desulfamplus sp.]|nr:response regulator [Desulfamplus sp.]